MMGGFRHSWLQRTGLLAAWVALIALAGAVPSAVAREIVVREGESLSLIAQRELGSMERWTELAQLNNIADPRRLQAGQRLLLPGGDEGMGTPSLPSGPLTAHLMGQPSLRRITGAVRQRVAGSTIWTDMVGATRFEPGLAVMTANTGRADFVADDLVGELGTFTVMSVSELSAEPRRAKFRLDLGDLTLRSSLTSVQVEARAAHVRIQPGEVRLQIDAAGTLRVTVLTGGAELVGPDGQRVPVEAGSVATVRPGSAAEVLVRSSPVRLVRPADGVTLLERDVQFEWQAAPGARGYLLQLTPEASGQPELRQEVANNSLEVRGIPDGSYGWRVTPRGSAEASPSPLARFTIDQRPPPLSLNPPVHEGGSWKLRGVTAPGAKILAGGLRLTADEGGDFVLDLGPLDGLTIVGVEARVRDGGAASRGGIAIAGRAPGRRVPVTVLVPTGQVLIDGSAAAESMELADGANRIAWVWEVSGQRVAGGSLAIALDLAPPEILAIRSTPERVGADENVSIFVRARDRGTGLGDASTASISLQGPDSAVLDLTAQSLSAGGEYLFTFKTPARLTQGMYRVTRLEVADRDGNAIILETRGTVIEARGRGVTAENGGVLPSTQREFLKDIFLIGIGALLGSL